MLTSNITRFVTLAILRRPAWIIAISLLFGILSTVYIVHYFKISTDVSQIIENEPGWAARGKAIDEAFPNRGAPLLIVVEAPAQEFASAVATELAGALAKEPERFKSVAQPEGGAFFEHNGLLSLPVPKVEETTKQLVQARPLINTIPRSPASRKR